MRELLTAAAGAEGPQRVRSRAAEVTALEQVTRMAEAADQLALDLGQEADRREQADSAAAPAHQARAVRGLFTLKPP